jgi:hypothetical protein
MTVTCCIRYVLDPFKRDEFEQCARRWQTIIRSAAATVPGFWTLHQSLHQAAPRPQVRLAKVILEIRASAAPEPAADALHRLAHVGR